jgi:DNA repair exonuclease SbcCD ATPase subunit
MKLTMENFLCYTQETFDFGSNGLTLITGPSGVGKTSIMRAIFFALFGDGNKVQSYGKTSCKVTLEFDDLKIIRTKRPNRLVLNDVYEDAVAQNIIDKKFGDTFKTSGYIQQNNLNSFILMSPTDKLLFLEQFAFKDIDLGNIKIRCKAHINKLHDELTTVNTELNMAKEFLNITEKPNKIEFPIKSKVSNYEKIHNNEIIKHKNCFTLIKKLDKKIKLTQKELNDLELFTVTKTLTEEAINVLHTKITSLQSKQKEIVYIGDQELLEIEEKLKLFLTQKELQILEKQYLEDKKQLENIREKELAEIEKEIGEIRNDLWQEYKKEEVSETISDLNDCLKDLEKVERLQKYNKQNFIDVNEHDKNKVKLEEFLAELETQKTLYRKILAQKEIYSCPNCDISLRLIDETLTLSSEMIDKDITEEDEEEILIKIEELKENIKNNQRKNLKEEEILQRINQNEKDIQSILDKYEDADMEKDSIKEDIEYLHSYSATEVQKEKRLYKLEKRELSKTYYTFENTLFETLEKISEYKNRSPNIINCDEEALRMQIITENQNKLQLNNLIDELFSVEKEYELNNSKLEKICKEYFSKYPEKNSKDSLEKNLQEFENEIITLEKKKEQHFNNLTQIEEWKKYTEEKEKYENLQEKVKKLEIKEKEVKSSYVASLTLKDNILKAESIAISNIIDTINTHARTYLDCFFDANPISVQLQAFKETKKATKPCINITIEYKGMECDLGMLSGGELARVVLAYTLALSEIFNTPLMLLDECTASLDQDLTSDVFEGIREHFSGKLVLIIAHQVVSGAFDKVIKL